MKKLFGLVILAPAFLLAWATSALADERNCGAPMPGFEVIGAVTVDNVIVTGEGRTCLLLGTTVTGNVVVEPTNALGANGATIAGNVEADGTDLVQLFRGTTVGGDVVIERSASVSPFVNQICGTIIGGNPKIIDNTISTQIGSGVCIGFLGGGNIVGGNVEVENNTGGVGIASNLIGGNLVCKNNLPAPTPGAANAVGGNKEDQCAAGF